MPDELQAEDRVKLNVINKSLALSITKVCAKQLRIVQTDKRPVALVCAGLGSFIENAWDEPRPLTSDATDILDQLILVQNLVHTLTISKLEFSDPYFLPADILTFRKLFGSHLTIRTVKSNPEGKISNKLSHNLEQICSTDHDLILFLPFLYNAVWPDVVTKLEKVSDKATVLVISDPVEKLVPKVERKFFVALAKFVCNKEKALLVYRRSTPRS